MLATFLLSTCLPAKSDAQVRNRMENWYTNWGIGYPFIEYPSPITGTAQLDNASIMLDLLGFYWPLDEQMILGGTINGWGDRYAAGGEHVQINAYTFGFSIMRFLQARVGDGFFLRSDIGPSRIVVDSSVLTSNLESDWGLGILVGGGYGFPVSPETRVLLHLNYSVRRIEGEQFTNFGIGVSGLF
ncbi:MAG: hypothetical protein R2834_01145 [Rhodothermales bacterium]